MALVWNTRQLLSSNKETTAIPVEFHFLSNRELYDSAINTLDRHHSSAGEWVLFGDNHWYSLSVITRPVYTIPQELCLSFDCFSRTETLGASSMHGPPIDAVAIELGALLSLLVREPLLPLGIRRLDGKPFRAERSAQFTRPLLSQPIPPKGLNSEEFRIILRGLANALEADSKALLAAAKLYHAALSISVYDVSTAYLLLVSAIECLSGHHLKSTKFHFDDVEKFKKIAEVISEISVSITDTVLIDRLKNEISRGEHFVKLKFRTFIEQFLPDEFWLKRDELRPDLHDTFSSAIDKVNLKKFLGKAYDARSIFTHDGTPFPSYVEVGISDYMRVDAMMTGINLVNLSSFVPLFIWFERLTHFVLCEYLFRVVAPGLAGERASRAKEERPSL